jgi:peroxiredoxin
MHKSVILPILGLVLGIIGAAAAANIMGMPETMLGAPIAFWGSIMAMMGYMISFPAMAKSGPGGIVLFFGTAIFTAFAMAELNPLPLALGVPILLAAMEGGFRMIFYKEFMRFRYAWFEPLMTLTAILAYVLANVGTMLGAASDVAAWPAWVAPLPVLGMAISHTMMVRKDAMKLRAFAKDGYNVRPGQQAPEFSLTNENDETISLSDYRGLRHVLIVFYRGDWCPFCQMMLRTYANNASRFQEKDILLMAIGPDSPEANRALVDKLGLDYHVLSDPYLEIAQKYGICINGHNPGNLANQDSSPLPAAFLIDKQGYIRYTSNPEQVGEFMDPSKIFPILEQLESPQDSKERTTSNVSQ